MDYSKKRTQQHLTTTQKRANSNLDKHIAADGEPGAEAQKIKDKLNHGRLGGS
jgi:hypothetical protein